MGALEDCHRGFREGLEEVFYRWGKLVASRPWPVIYSTFIFSALCSLGWLLFRIQYSTDELWIPSTSPFKSNKAWQSSHFTSNGRYGNIIIKGDNVLTPEGLREMYLLHEKMWEFRQNELGFKDMCYMVPIEDPFWQGKTPSCIKKKHAPKTTETTVTTTEDTTSSNPDDYDDDDDDFWDDYEYTDYTDESSDEEEINENENKTETALNTSTTNKKDEEETFIDKLPPEIYCDIVTTLDNRCYEKSLLEIWDFDRETIFNVTQEEIIEAVNCLTISPWFWNSRNYTEDLGGVHRNETGHVVKAKAFWVQILVEVPDDAVKVDEGGLGFEFAAADEFSLSFEKFLIDFTAEQTDRNGFTHLAFTARSWNDVSFQTILFDIWKMLGGYVLMFAFTVSMLGRLNSLDVRLYLSAAGLFSCILSLGAAFGIMFLMGMEYNQTHHILPFIAIGIGIDDMFVIMECWYNLLHVNKDLPFPERIGETMRHAGISVTVTSITDVCAFGLGAFTIMPGLQAFCVSAAICIALIYILQVSWFVAWMSIDQKRIDLMRHGILPCITVQESSENDSEEEGLPLSKRLMSAYSSLLDYTLFKVSVLLISCGLLAFGVFGAVNIVQRFDPQRMLPPGNYLTEWINTQNEFWPRNGLAVQVLTGTLQLEDLAGLDTMVTQLEQLTQEGPDQILLSVSSWWPPFKSFLMDKKNTSWTELEDTAQFQMYLSNFLFDVSHSGEQPNFKFNGTLECNEPAPPIMATRQQLNYGMSSSLPPPSEYLPAKALVDRIVTEANISSRHFAISPIYNAWETDSIINEELWRNLALCLIAVAAVSLVLLGDIRLTVMVVCCVMATLVDLVGTLHFWDVTIDVIVCVNIVLACGLSVDYSVHIAHSFSVAEGTGTERAKTSLITMGPAIVNAGITTVLAVIILPFSGSHVFLSFFKVFILTVLYGLFHGLVFLPAILASCGSSKQPPKSESAASPKISIINPVFVD